MIIDTVKSIEWDLQLDYGELKNDVDFVEKCENLVDSLSHTHKILEKLLVLRTHYDELTLDQKIELDLLLVYMLNSLHWIDLRIKGIDVTKHQIRHVFERIKAAMLRWKEMKERVKRPKVNVEAAKRFVRSGLYDHQNSSGSPPNKKIRFD